MRILGYAHGAGWKFLSMGGKLLFLLVVVPGLVSGVYAQYYFTITVGLICGRIISFGVLDQLAISLGGSKEKADKYRGGFEIVISICLLMLVAGSIYEHEYLLILAMSFVILADSMLIGLVRGISAPLYEIQINMPWVLYVGLVLAFQASTLALLVSLLMASYLLAMVVVYVAVFGVPVIWRSSFHRANIRPWLLIARQGVYKMISDLLLIFNMRSIVILNKLIKGSLISDSLAIALTIAEGCWQFGMVIVNRNYQHYISGSAELSKAARNSFVIFLIMLLGTGIAVALSATLGFELLQKINPRELMACLLFFSVLTAILDIRNGLWAKFSHATRGMGALFLLALLQFLLVYMLQPVAVIIANFLIMLIFYFGCLFFWKKIILHNESAA